MAFHFPRGEVINPQKQIVPIPHGKWSLIHVMITCARIISKDSQVWYGDLSTIPSEDLRKCYLEMWMFSPLPTFQASQNILTKCKLSVKYGPCVNHPIPQGDLIMLVQSTGMSKMTGQLQNQLWRQNLSSNGCLPFLAKENALQFCLQMIKCFLDTFLTDLIF